MQRLVVAVASVAVCVLAWYAFKFIRFRWIIRELEEAGFPADYAERLARLKIDHPKWTFVPLPVKDLNWSAVVDREMTPSWCLVRRSDWAPGKWRTLKGRNYAPYFAKDAKVYDSGAWCQACREAVAYFLDPRNFFNERDVFMFETLGYDAESQTREGVERVLFGTFMDGACYDGGDRPFSELIWETGRRLGLSPVFLAGRLASEQGQGSVQSRGKIGDALFSFHSNAVDRVGNHDIWGVRFTRTNEHTRAVIARGPCVYNGFYNLFNFRASGTGLFEIQYNAWVEATCEETRKRYLGPWNTQARAIEGGALKIKERFVDTCRHTRYLQKFSVLTEAGPYRWKQYMQNVAAPLVESRKAFRAYSKTGTLNLPFRFLIPVYRGMPPVPCPDPAGGQSVYSPSR